MSVALPTRRVRRCRIYCPVDQGTLDLIAAGRLSSIDRGSALGAILDIVRDDNPLGDFGLYTSVVELTTGWELFTPAARAKPTLGEPGRAEASPTAVLTVHVPTEAAADVVQRAIAAIVAAHPWEVPVIEMSEVDLVLRG